MKPESMCKRDAAQVGDDQRKLKATQLFNHLFEACNILRGPINQDEFKAYVIPILFLKRISDCYDEETAAAKAKYGDDVSLYTEEELHPFKMPPGCHWSDIRGKVEDIGKAIIDAMMELESVNHDSLNGLFSSFDDANWTVLSAIPTVRTPDGKDVTQTRWRVQTSGKTMVVPIGGELSVGSFVGTVQEVIDDMVILRQSNGYTWILGLGDRLSAAACIPAAF